jgi:CheY-like chemotaxis protein
MNTTAESNNRNSRVLIVDDNSEFTHRASEFLQNTHRYVVCEENNPRKALETARNFHPDLILLDLIMPQADGTEVAAQITSDWMLHSVPIAGVLWKSFYRSEPALAPFQSAAVNFYRGRYVSR